MHGRTQPFDPGCIPASRPVFDPPRLLGIGVRQGVRSGINDAALGRRHAYHWLLALLAFTLVFLPVISGKVSAEAAAINVLLVAGLAYTLAGIHLERPLLWSGLLVFSGYIALATLELPYVWTITGLVVAASLVLAGLTRRKRESLA